MGLEAFTGLLDSPPNFATASDSECRHYLSRSARSAHVDFGFNLHGASKLVAFSHHAISLGQVSLDLVRLNSTRGFSIAKTYGTQIAFQFPLGGRCRLHGGCGERFVDPGEVFVPTPEQATLESWDGDCSLVTVRLDREVFDHAVSQELHRTMSRPVAFESVVHDPGILPWILHMATDLRCARPDSIANNWRVTRDLERTLLTMLLTGLPNSESDNFARTGQGTAPYYVRRAEGFIRESARETLTIEAIATAAGVSPRTLFYGFKRWRNTTPMAYGRDVRLDIARGELEKARVNGGTVARAANNAGFSNLSQFSRLYKARFSESPSATLKSP